MKDLPGTAVVPARKGGLDRLWDILVKRFKEDARDEEDHKVEALENVRRKPGQSLKSFLMEFNQKYYTACKDADVYWSDEYKIKQ